MKKVLLTVSALLMMSSGAMAAQIGMGEIEFVNGGNKIIMQWTANDDPGGGLTRYEVFLNDPLDAKLSYFLQDLGFTGEISQRLAFAALAVNDEVNAATFNANPAATYSAVTDSFFFTPFTANTVGTGITDSVASPPQQGVASRTYGITAGSGGGSQLDFVQIAQIVASGDVAVGGAVARNGVVLTGAGTMTAAPIPEPSTLVLLGLGMVGVAGYARRRRKSA